MRNYQQNSPQAAARIVALSLLADGHLDAAELAVLHRLRAHEQLGLSADDLHGVVQSLCEDLLSGAEVTWADACTIDPYLQSQILAEVTDPALQAKVLALCVAVVEADAHVSEGESIVLSQAVEHWGMQGAMLAPRATAAALS